MRSHHVAFALYRDWTIRDIIIRCDSVFPIKIPFVHDGETTGREKRGAYNELSRTLPTLSHDAKTLWFFFLFSLFISFDDPSYTCSSVNSNIGAVGIRAIKPRSNEVGGLRNAVLNNDRMRFCSAGRRAREAHRNARSGDPGRIKNRSWY